MNIKERLHLMIDDMTEEQANALLIVLHTSSTENEKAARKKKAYEDMERIIRSIPEVGDIDEKKELAEYRDERYGEGL